MLMGGASMLMVPSSPYRLYRPLEMVTSASFGSLSDHLQRKCQMMPSSLWGFFEKRFFLFSFSSCSTVPIGKIFFVFFL